SGATTMIRESLVFHTGPAKALYQLSRAAGLMNSAWRSYKPAPACPTAQAPLSSRENSAVSPTTAHPCSTVLKQAKRRFHHLPISRIHANLLPMNPAFD